MSLYLFLSNLGRDVVLEVVSLVNVPGSPLTVPVNPLVLVIPLTVYVLLNPELEIPVVLFVLVTFLISTTDPTDKL